MTEMQRLITLLAKNDIPFELTVHPFTSTIQVWYPTRANSVCDVICHEYSYGGKDGYLEIMGLVDEKVTGGDSVEGYLMADEVYERIAKDYSTRKLAEEVENEKEAPWINLADWLDFWFVDDESGEEFFVEVRDTEHALADATEIARANFESPRWIATITPEEAETIGYDTY